MQASIGLSASQSGLASRSARRFQARNADRLRSQILGIPRSHKKSLPVCASAQKQVERGRCHLVSLFVCMDRSSESLYHVISVHAVDVAPPAKFNYYIWMQSDGVDACLQSEKLAAELAQKLPAAALAAMIGTLSVTSANVANAADYYTPPSGSSTTETVKQPQQSLEFPSGSTAVAPSVKSGDYQLPEGNQWRYSEFINAVQNSKVERVRFSKDGGQLQVCNFPLLLSIIGVLF